MLAEDGLLIGEPALDLLRAESYAVDWVKAREMADTAQQHTQTCDLVLLDRGLLWGDGPEVLIATARDSVRQRIEGLDAGADDYVLKPASRAPLASHNHR